MTVDQPGIVRQARALVGETCYEDPRDLKSIWCIDVWVRSAEVGFLVKEGMDQDWLTNQQSRRDYLWCNPDNSPGNEWFYRRICPVVGYMMHRGTWSPGCANPGLGSLITSRYYGNPAWHGRGEHSGVISGVTAKTQKVCMIIACSAIDRGQVVERSPEWFAQRGAFGPGDVIGCGYAPM